MKKQQIHLTNRERQILDIMWDSDTPMTASEIVSVCPDLTKSTVQAVLRKLLAYEYISVADIVHSGTVLCRRYRPTFSRAQFLAAQLKNTFDAYHNVSKVDIFSGLLGGLSDSPISLEEIRTMEKMLKEYKNKLQER